MAGVAVDKTAIWQAWPAAQPHDFFISETRVRTWKSAFPEE
jgi:hypothetical protein